METKKKYDWKKDWSAFLLMTVVFVWLLRWIIEYVVRDNEPSIHLIWPESFMIIIAAMIYSVHFVFFTEKGSSWPNLWRYLFLGATLIGYSFFGYLLISVF
ncbi:MAG: hypothetical protein R3275_04805 [Saprospiraceae bacterium]|nr:hypothetical protein [Saprospiraceae bacterium]